MFRNPYYLILLVLAACLAHTVSAQPAGQTNYFWSGAGDGATWSQGANWTTGIAPVNNGTTYQVFIGTGFPTTTPTPITIGVADTVQLNDSLFGPEWGETLNINGSVTAGFGWFPLGDMAGNASVINLYGNSSFTAGDTISLGDTWWFPGGPHVIMNLYDNSQVTTKYFWLGGHLNLYGGTMTVLNFFGAGTATDPVFTGGLDTDATRLIDIAGGKLILPGDATAEVNDWITRGILEGNGIAGNVNIDLLSDPGNTVITVPEPASVALFGLSGFAMILAFRRRYSGTIS